MTWPVIVQARIAQGRLVLPDLDWRGAKSGPVQVTIERHYATRSLSQNARYWALLTALAEHTGYEVDELHEHFKREFLGRPLVLADARGVVLSDGKVGQSTTRMTTKEFAAYMDRIGQVAAEMGIESW